MRPLVHPPKLSAGDKVSILSPSFAAPAVAPELHEQALRRLADLTGVVPVEFPTTRALGSSPAERAADPNAALADPEIRAIHATIGDSDQISGFSPTEAPSPSTEAPQSYRLVRVETT